MADKEMDGFTKNGSAVPNEGAAIKVTAHSKMTLLRQQMEENRKKLQRREQEISNSKRNFEQLMGSFEGMERSLSISSVASESDFAVSDTSASTRNPKEIFSPDDSRSSSYDKDCQLLKSKLSKVEEEKKKIKEECDKRYRNLDELNKSNEEKCSKLKSENAQLSEKVKLLTNTTDKLEEEKRKLKEELNDKEDEKELGQIEVETRYNHLRKEHQQMQDRFHYLHEEVNGKNQLISDWKTRYQSLEETYEEMSNRYQVLSAQSKSLSNEQQEDDQVWKNRYQLLESELESVMQNKQDLEKDYKERCDELNIRIQSLESEKEKQAEDLQTAQQLLDQERETSQSLRVELTSFESEAGRFTQLLLEHEALSKEFQTLKDAYEKQSEDYGYLTHKYQEVSQSNGPQPQSVPVSPNDAASAKSKNQRGKKKAKKFSELVPQPTVNGSDTAPKADVMLPNEITALESKLEEALQSKELLEAEKLALTGQWRQDVQELCASLLDNLNKLSQAEELIRTLHDRLNILEARQHQPVAEHFDESWKAERASLEADLSHMQQELSKKESEVSRLKLELTEWGTSEEMESPQDAGKFEKDFTNLEAQIALKEGELEDANQELSLLRAELEELRAQTGDEAGNAQGEIFKLNAKLKDLEYWLSERNNAIHVLEQDLQAKCGLVQELKLQVEVDSRTLRNAEEQLADDAANREALEERLEGKEAEVQRLHQALRKLEALAQGMDTQVLEKSAELMRLNEDLQEAELVLNEKDAKIKTLVEENHDLKIKRDSDADSFANFTEISKHCKTLEMQLQDREDQLHKLQSYNNLSVAHVQEAEGSRKESESQYQALKEQMKQTQGLLTEKEDALEKLTEKYKKVAALLKQKLVLIQNLEAKSKSQPAAAKAVTGAPTGSELQALTDHVAKLEASNNLLSAELQQRKSDVVALRDEISAKDQIFAANEQDMRQFYEQELVQLHQRLGETEEALKSRLSEAKTEIATLKRDLESSSCLVDELNRGIASSRARVDELEIQFRETVQQVSETQLQSLQETGSRALSEVAALQEQLAQLVTVCDRQSAELEQSKINVVALREEIMAKDEMLSVSEQDLRQVYEEQLTQLHQRLSETDEAWKGRLSEAESEIATLQHDWEKSSHLVHQLTQEFECSRIRADQLQSQCDASIQHASTSESQLCSLQENLAITQNYLQDAEKQIAALETDLDRCKSTMEKRTTELSQAQHHIAALSAAQVSTAELREAQNHNEHLLSQVGSLVDQLKSAEEDRQRLEDQIYSLEQSLSEVNAECDAARNENKTFYEELQTLRERLRFSEEFSEKLRAQLVESQQEAEQVKIQDHHNQSANVALEQELTALREQLEQLTSLENELFQVRGALADALQKYEEAQARVVQLEAMTAASEAENELEVVKMQWEESRRGHEYYYQECQNVFAQLEYAQAELARIQAELETSETARADLIQELEESRVKSEEYPLHFATLTSERNNLEEEMNQVRESFDQYRSNMQSQVTQNQQALQLLKTSYAETRVQTEAYLKQGRDDLCQDLAISLAKWQELESIIHPVQVQLSQEQNHSAALQSQLEGMVTQMEGLQSTCDYNLAQWHALEAELERVKAEHTMPDLAQAVDELKAQLLESQKNVEYYTQEWHNQNAQLWHLDGLLRSAQQECEETKAANAIHTQELADLKVELEQATQERQHYQDEWEKLTLSSEESVALISGLQSEIAALQKYQEDFESQTETLVDTQKLLSELNKKSFDYEQATEVLRVQLSSEQNVRQALEMKEEKLREQVRNLQGQLERLQVDLSELQSLMTTKTEQVEYYQTEWQKAVNQLDGLHSELSLVRSREEASQTSHQELEELHHQWQELQAKYDALEREARVAKADNQELVNTGVEQAGEIAELLAVVKDLEQSVSISEQTRSTMNDDILQLRGMLSQAEEDKSNLQSQIDQMQNQITTLQSEAGHVETSSENLSNQVTILQAALHEKEIQWAALTQDFERLQRDRRNLQQVCNLLEEEKEELEAKLAALELDKETWETDISQLKDRNATLQAEIVRLKEELAHKRESVPLQQAAGPDNRMVEELENLLATSRQETERLAAELQSTKVKSAKFLRQVKQLQAEREKSKSPKLVDDPLQQLAQEEMQSQIDQANQSSSALKEKLTVLQTERDRLAAQLDVMHTAQDTYLEHKEKLEAENSLLLQSNKALSATVASLEWRISELEENLQSLKESTVEEKMDTAKAEADLSGDAEVVEEPVVAHKAWETTDDKELVNLREEITSLLEEKAQLAQENEEFQDVLDEFKVEVDRLKSENDFYIDIVRQLSMTGTLSPSTIAKLREELQSSNVDLDVSLSEDDYANEPNYWQKTLNDLQMEVEFLRSRNSMLMFRLKEAGLDLEEDLSEEDNPEALELMHMKAALDNSMMNLHERDVRCQELGWEISKLVEERDTLQIRLSDALRQLYGQAVPVASEAESHLDLDKKLRAIKDASVQIDRNMQAYGKNARDAGEKIQRPSPGTTALLAQWLRGKSLHRVHHV